MLVTKIRGRDLIFNCTLIPSLSHAVWGHPEPSDSNNMVVSLAGLGIKNHCAGEDQQSVILCWHVCVCVEESASE
jgi:hypothetical protein